MATKANIKKAKEVYEILTSGRGYSTNVVGDKTVVTQGNSGAIGITTTIYTAIKAATDLIIA